MESINKANNIGTKVFNMLAVMPKVGLKLYQEASKVSDLIFSSVNMLLKS